jgi:hypothetical protein
MKNIVKTTISAAFGLLLSIINSQAASPSFTFSGFSLTAGTSVDLLTKFSTDSDAPTSAYTFSIVGNSASLSGTSLLGISGGIVTVTGYVSSTLGFTEGNVSSIVTIINQTPTLGFSLFDLTVGGSNIDLNQYFVTNSPGSKTYSINGKTASLDGSTLSGLNDGSVLVYGFVASATGFNSAFATISVPIYNQNPTVTFNGFNISLGTASTPGVNLSTLLLSNSLGTKSFTIVGDSTTARLTGNIISATGLGSVTITGNIAKAQGFSAVSKTIVVNVTKNLTPQLVAPATVSGLFGLVRRLSEKKTITISGTNLNGNITITSSVNLKISSVLVSVPGTRVVQPISSGQASVALQIELANANTATVVSGVITITSGTLRQTIAVFGEVVSSTITGTTTGIEDELNGEQADLLAFPNPAASGNTIYFSRSVSGVLINQDGKIVAQLFKEVDFNTGKLVPSIYIFRSIEGKSLKIKIE